MATQTKQRTVSVTRTRDESIGLRLSARAKRMLTAAAELERRSVSDFVLNSAMAKAEETLADQRHFVLNAEQWKAFQDALDAPDRDLPGMRRLLSEPSVLERHDS